MKSSSISTKNNIKKKSNFNSTFNPSSSSSSLSTTLPLNFNSTVSEFPTNITKPKIRKPDHIESPFGELTSIEPLIKDIDRLDEITEANIQKEKLKEDSDMLLFTNKSDSLLYLKNKNNLSDMDYDNEDIIENDMINIDNNKEEDDNEEDIEDDEEVDEEDDLYHMNHTNIDDKNIINFHLHRPLPEINFQSTIDREDIIPTSNLEYDSNYTDTDLNISHLSNNITSDILYKRVDYLVKKLKDIVGYFDTSEIYDNLATKIKNHAEDGKSNHSSKSITSVTNGFSTSTSSHIPSLNLNSTYSANLSLRGNSINFKRYDPNLNKSTSSYFGPGSRSNTITGTLGGAPVNLLSPSLNLHNLICSPNKKLFGASTNFDESRRLSLNHKFFNMTMAENIQLDNTIKSNTNLNSSLNNNIPIANEKPKLLTQFSIISIDPNQINGKIPLLKNNLRQNSMIHFNYPSQTNIPFTVENLNEFCFPYGAKLTLINKKLYEERVLNSFYNPKYQLLQFTDEFGNIFYSYSVTVIEQVNEIQNENLLYNLFEIAFFIIKRAVRKYINYKRNVKKTNLKLLENQKQQQIQEFNSNQMSKVNSPISKNNSDKKLIEGKEKDKEKAKSGLRSIFKKIKNSSIKKKDKEEKKLKKEGKKRLSDIGVSSASKLISSSKSPNNSSFKSINSTKIPSLNSSSTTSVIASKHSSLPQNLNYNLSSPVPKLDLSSSSHNIEILSARNTPNQITLTKRNNSDSKIVISPNETNSARSKAIIALNSSDIDSDSESSTEVSSESEDSESDLTESESFNINTDLDNDDDVTVIASSNKVGTNNLLPLSPVLSPISRNNEFDFIQHIPYSGSDSCSSNTPTPSNPRKLFFSSVDVVSTLYLQYSKKLTIITEKSYCIVSQHHFPLIFYKVLESLIQLYNANSLPPVLSSSKSFQLENSFNGNKSTDTMISSTSFLLSNKSKLNLLSLDSTYKPQQDEESFNKSSMTYIDFLTSQRIEILKEKMQRANLNMSYPSIINSLIIPQQPLDITEWTLSILLYFIPIDIIIQVHYLLMVEKSLVVIGSDAGLVSLVTTAFSKLLYPFKWVGIFVPILPPLALEVLDPPCPFITGLVLPSLFPTESKNKFNKELTRDNIREKFFISSFASILYLDDLICYRENYYPNPTDFNSLLKSISVVDANKKKNLPKLKFFDISAEVSIKGSLMDSSINPHYASLYDTLRYESFCFRTECETLGINLKSSYKNVEEYSENISYITRNILLLYQYNSSSTSSTRRNSTYESNSHRSSTSYRFLSFIPVRKALLAIQNFCNYVAGPLGDEKISTKLNSRQDILSSSSNSLTSKISKLVQLNNPLSYHGDRGWLYISRSENKYKSITNTELSHEALLYTPDLISNPWISFASFLQEVASTQMYESLLGERYLNYVTDYNAR